MAKHLGFTYTYHSSKSWGIQLPDGQLYGSRFDVCLLPRYTFLLSVRNAFKKLTWPQVQRGLADMALDNVILPRGPKEPPLAGTVSMSNFCYTRDNVFMTTKPKPLPPRLGSVETECSGQRMWWGYIIPYGRRTWISLEAGPLNK